MSDSERNPGQCAGQSLVTAGCEAEEKPNGNGSHHQTQGKAKIGRANDCEPFTGQSRQIERPFRRVKR